MIRLIAAIDAKRGLATDTGIPWRLPGDVTHFRRRTSEGVILMGRGTYEEFALPLHDRDNFVLTSSTESLRPGFRTVGDLNELLGSSPEHDVWVIGGAMVFGQALPHAGELVLTQVLGDFKCTKFFPPYEGGFSMADSSDDYEDDTVNYRFETWRRKDRSSG